MIEGEKKTEVKEMEIKKLDKSHIGNEGNKDDKR